MTRRGKGGKPPSDGGSNGAPDSPAPTFNELFLRRNSADMEHQTAAILRGLRHLGVDHKALTRLITFAAGLLDNPAEPLDESCGFSILVGVLISYVQSVGLHLNKDDDGFIKELAARNNLRSAALNDWGLAQVNRRVAAAIGLRRKCLPEDLQDAFLWRLRRARSLPCSGSARLSPELDEMEAKLIQNDKITLDDIATILKWVDELTESHRVALLFG
jgi:hypothetical protein